MRNLRASLLSLLLAAVPAGAQAQQQPIGTELQPELVDGVIAVVGDSVVLRSEVQEQLIDMARAGQRLPEDPVAMERLQRRVLNGIIEELVLLQAAAEDSIEIPQQQVEEMADETLRGREQAFGGRRPFEEALRREGMTYSEYRDLLVRQLRRRELIQTYLQKQRTRAMPPVTEDELRAYFEAQGDRFGERPATVSFEQVVVAPEPTDSARAAARAEIEEIQRQLVGGEDFSTLARRHSDDPGTREQGGDLGWFRQGRMVKAFDEVVFGMRPGQVSGIVETPFGFHLIKLEKVKGAERQARHILISPAVTDADREEARLTAERVAEQLQAGASIDSLIARHHDDTEQSEIPPYPRDQLPPPYDQLLAESGEGAVVGPVQLAEGAQAKWAVVQVQDVAEAGEVSYEDVRAGLRRELQQQKLVAELVEQLRRRMYVDIRL